MIPVQDVDGQKLTREYYLHCKQQLWDGCILAGDARHKYLKIVGLGATVGGDRARSVYGIFTVFNEYEQVLSQDHPLRVSRLVVELPIYVLLHLLCLWSAAILCLALVARFFVYFSN